MEYAWSKHPTGEVQGDGTFLDGETNMNKFNHFRADSPGDVELSYKVQDVAAGYESESPDPQKVIHIRPKLNITTPSEHEKFCYGIISPHLLSINATATAVPSSIESEIEWVISEIGESNLQTIPSPPAGSEVTFLYLGLPSQNKEFGPNTIEAQLNNYNTRDSVNILIFYKKMLNDNPGGALPNWFYYWGEGHVVPGINTVQYDYRLIVPGIYRPNQDPNRDSVYIGDNSTMEFPSYEIGDFAYIFCEASGIDYCATTIEHEKYHQWTSNNWRGPNGVWFVEYGPHPYWVGGDPNPNDIDGDRLPSAYEDSISHANGFFTLDPLNSDTYGVADKFGERYRSYGDNELMARFLSDGATGVVVRDWSHGLYSKQWPED